MRDPNDCAKWIHAAPDEQCSDFRDRRLIDDELLHYKRRDFCVGRKDAEPVYILLNRWFSLAAFGFRRTHRRYLLAPDNISGKRVGAADLYGWS